MSRLLQVVLAIVGLVLTGVLQLASNRNAEVQNAQAQVQLYTQVVAAAVATCNQPLLFVAQDTAIALDELHRQGKLQGSTNFGEHLEAVRNSMTNCPNTGGQVVASAPVVVAPGAGQQPQVQARAAPVVVAPPAPIAPELVQQSQNLELRGAEQRAIEESKDSRGSGLGAILGGAVQSSRRLTEGRFFAVLASYNVNEDNTYDAHLGAVEHFRRLRDATRSAGAQLQLYRTHASNHFAIVLAPEGLTRAGAQALVTAARREGWAQDAFVQIDRDWARCETPDTIEGLRACAQT